MKDALPTIYDALGQPSDFLARGLLLKAADFQEEDDRWVFAGIASDESTDVDGDEILKKHLDLTYAQQRGFVNWDHSRSPSDQIGFLTEATLVGEADVPEMKRRFGSKIGDSPSVFVKGELYKYVERAKEVHNIMKSSGRSGLGLSLDGVVARDPDQGDVVRAFVRGVAITPVPAQPKTLATLSKSLRSYNAPVTPDVPQSTDVVEDLQRSYQPVGMDFDQAILWYMKQRPHFTYELASKLVKYAFQQRS